MAKRGIDNVLGTLVGPLEPVDLPEPKVRPAPEPASSLPAKPALEVETETPKAKSVAARRGRPPGSRAGGTADKKKVTWSIDPDLYEAFVKRSYREECQVWELLERAIKDYLKKAERE